MQKWQKYVSIILGLLLLSVIIIRVNLEDILVSRLNQLIKQDENRLYDYKYDLLDINISSGDILLTNLKFVPRRKIIDSLNQLNQAKEQIFLIELKAFKLKGLEIFSFLVNGSINLEEISFLSPDVSIYNNAKYKSNNEEKKDLDTEKAFFSDIVSKGLKEAKINVLAFENAKLKVFNVDNDTSLSLAADSSNFFIKGIIANEKTLNGKELFFYDSSSIDLRNIKIYSIADYRLEFGRFYKSSTEEDIYFSNVILSPDQDKKTFMLHKEYQTEWFKFLIKDMNIKELDIIEYQRTRNINAAHFNINGVDLEIYRDNRLKKKGAKYKALLGEKLRNIGLPINVQSISIKNANVDYQEMEGNAEEPLHVHFNDLDLDISNFSTDSNTLIKNDTLEIEVNGTFMQKGVLSLNLSFKVLDSINSFHIKGSLKKLQLNELNPILKNSAFIMFTDGYLNNLAFDMEGNNNVITGGIDIDYEELNNLQILRKKDEMDERKKKGKRKKSDKALLSFLASNIAPVEYNAQSKHYHRGEVSFNRNTNKSIIHFIINGLKSGILDSFLHNHEGLVKKLKEKKEKKKTTN